MEKEEILARSREEKEDEGRIVAENQGNRLAVVLMTVMFCFFVLFNFAFDYSIAMPMAMYGGFIVAGACGKYRFDGKKKHLFWAAAGVLIFGGGMALCLEGATVAAIAGGIALSIVGAALCGLAHLTKKCARRRLKEKYGDEILRLTEQLLGGEGGGNGAK